MRNAANERGPGTQWSLSCTSAGSHQRQEDHDLCSRQLGMSQISERHRPVLLVH